MAFHYLTALGNLYGQYCVPLLFRNKSVFHVVLRFGDCKPNNLEFLNEFIRDLSSVLQNGLQHGNECLKVCLRCHM